MKQAVIALSPLLFFSSGIATLQAPYDTPEFVSFSSKKWPSASEWASLNASLGGRLENLRPWAAVCYSSDPLFDYDECQTVLTGYDNDTVASRAFFFNTRILSIPLKLAGKRSGGSAVGELGGVRLWEWVSPEL